MARSYSKKLNAGLAFIDKRRRKQNVAEVMNIIGEVKGKNILIVDDLIDTAGTLTNAAAALKDRGARSEEHTSELQSRGHLVCRLLLEKKKMKISRGQTHRRLADW